MAKITSKKELKTIKEEFLGKKNRYKYVLNVCFGGGCLSSNCEAVKDALVKELENCELLDEVLINQTGCIGACDLGPSILVEPDNTYYIKLDPEDVGEIVKRHIIDGEIVREKCYYDPNKDEFIPCINDIEFFKRQEKIVLKNCGVIDYGSIDGYIANDGYGALAKAVTDMSPEEVIDVMKESGLRGRGGGGFPTGLKWSFAYKAKGDQKYVICNADEGDPGAFMDRSLLEGDPHGIIEGMALAGYAVGASMGYVYVRAEYPIAIERLEKAIKDAKEYGLLAGPLFGSDFTFDLEIRIGAGAFVCGEETALIHSIEGKRGEPRQKPPFPANSGLFNKPTVINNVETYANVPKIIFNGAEWFKGFGTEKSPGTKVFALAGAVRNTGIVEVPMGISLGDIIYDIGGGIKNDKKFKAAQTGGPSGGCLTQESLNVPVDYDSLKELGSIMGSGGLVIMDEDNCMVDVARYFMDFVQEESCGKCVPCRLGTKRMLEILERITRGEGEEDDINKLVELGDMIKESALCGLGQTAPNPVISTLKHFKHEYEEHIQDKKCTAGACGDMFLSPCENACPAGINVPGYIALIAANRVKDAYDLIRQENPFPAVCGRVCTHPCEYKCRRAQLDEPIAIADLKRYASDVVLKEGIPSSNDRYAYNGKSIAVVGAGPSGLSCGYYLARLGYDVTVYEQQEVAGGILAFGIPEYRLPKAMLDKEIKAIEQEGVKIKLGVEVGNDISFEELREQHEAVFVATGTQFSNKIGIDGEELDGVYYGLDFLRDVNTGKETVVGKKVAIIGGGNTAIDASRVALRLGAEEVHILYRRRKKDMPADWREIEEAVEEGIQIHTMIKPVSIEGEDGKVKSIKMQKMILGMFDRSGRRRPVEVEGQVYAMEFDMIIPAISQYSDLPFIKKEEVETTKWGTFVVDDDTMMTNLDGVFAGGDVVRGPDTVIQAIADGKKVAESIDMYLGGEGVLNKGPEIEIPSPVDYAEVVEHDRFPMNVLDPEDRSDNFDEVVYGFHRLNAIAESMRCLRCDRR
ncbi:NADH-quinone oxidoreductase subunit NuoF [Vallitalea okinawensis]|uniref:NADH-quinone oxidoreductase subunit NuoF n=1 Tax=Vallitalea okinawensis TaxID=2078660 RepID=UPI000CFBE0CA|nr:NADH-quinone oxidoreductase subunit NuoF [Vallitalea okinawensis]